MELIAVMVIWYFLNCFDIVVYPSWQTFFDIYLSIIASREVSQPFSEETELDDMYFTNFYVVPLKTGHLQILGRDLIPASALRLI